MVKNLSHPQGWWIFLWGASKIYYASSHSLLCRSVSVTCLVMNPCWRQIYRAGWTFGLGPVCLFLLSSAVVVLPSRTIFLPCKQSGIPFSSECPRSWIGNYLIHRSHCDSTPLPSPLPSLLLVSTERNEEMEQVPRCSLKGSLVEGEFFSDRPGSSGWGEK